MYEDGHLRDTLLYCELVHAEFHIKVYLGNFHYSTIISEHQYVTRTHSQDHSYSKITTHRVDHLIGNGGRALKQKLN